MLFSPLLLGKYLYTDAMAKKRKRVMSIHEAASRGGDARAKALTPQRRSEIARDAVLARWSRQVLPTAPIPEWEFSRGEKIDTGDK